MIFCDWCYLVACTADYNTVKWWKTNLMSSSWTTFHRHHHHYHHHQQQQHVELMMQWCRLTLIVQTQFLLILYNQELCVDVSDLSAQLHNSPSSLPMELRVRGYFLWFTINHLHILPIHQDRKHLKMTTTYCMLSDRDDRRHVRLVHLEDRIADETKSDVIYKISCKNCDRA